MFPLRSRGAQLVDAQGEPFFYQADTAWQIFFNQSLDAADWYFAERKRQGYTAIQVQLTGFLNQPDLAGRLPFDGDHDFTRPNEAFFRHVEAYLDLALSHGLLVAIAPLWSCCCGTGWAGTFEDGSPRPLNRQGPAVAREFGRWVGQRFARYPHLLWILGGDNDPFNAYEEIVALAEGLKAGHPTALATYHASSTHSSTDVFPDAPWLDVSMTYTYHRFHRGAWNKVQPDVYEVNLLERRKPNPRPFFLGESTYEGEHGEFGSPSQVRKQAYWSTLTGAIGHAAGTANWHMRMPVDTPFPGIASLRHLADLVREVGTSAFFPDDEILVDPSLGWAANDAAIGARNPVTGTGILYVPSPRELILTKVPKRAEWVDPTSGERMELQAKAQLETPTRNSAGDSDGVVVLQW